MNEGNGGQETLLDENPVLDHLRRHLGIDPSDVKQLTKLWNLVGLWAKKDLQTFHGQRVTNARHLLHEQFYEGVEKPAGPVDAIVNWKAEQKKKGIHLGCG